MKTFTDLVDRLSELAFLHRAIAQIGCGWIAKIPVLEIKTKLAQHAYEDLETANKLYSHLYALTRTPPEELLVPAGAKRALQAIDLAPTADHLLVAIYGIARRHLYEAYEELATLADPVLDANVFYIAHPAVELLRRQARYGQEVLQARLHGGMDNFAIEVEALFKQRRTEARLKAKDALWAPVDRVPAAARPEHMTRAKPGAMRALPLDSGRDREGVALFLHNLINGEYTTMELAARSLYEHPDMPAAFHLQLARQAADEARHAEVLERALAKLGHRYGDFPIYTLTYDGYYEIPGAAPGSKTELLWRLLIRGTVDEGLALDDFQFQIERRELLEQAELADLFRYLIADESFHVQAALKWSRFLCGNDETKVLAERERANQAVNTFLDERRKKFVAAFPEEAMAELLHKRRVAALEAKDPLPFARKLNVSMRRSVGYTERDLEQLRAWGYAP